MRYLAQLVTSTVTSALLPGFNDAHSVHSFGTRNTEGRRVLEFAFASGNTWFKKRNTHLITYSCGGDSIQLDSILSQEFQQCCQQSESHHQQRMHQTAPRGIVCEFPAHIPYVKKCKFSSHIRTWKLREPVIASQFQSAFKVKTMTAVAAIATAAGDDADTANHVESAWSKLKGPLLDVAT